jgi:hypothetical protein
MGQRMWDNVVMFPFDEIYPISFINKFNFVNFLSTRNDSLHIIHSLKLFKVQIPLGMNQ